MKRCAIKAATFLALACTLISAANLNLSVKPTAVPNSCEWGIYEVEFKITNVDAGNRFLKNYYITGAFASLDEIAPIHGTANISSFSAEGAYIGSEKVTVSVNGSGSVPSCEAGLNKGVYFNIRVNTPEVPGAPWLEVTENGGYATVTVQFIRGEGLFPFDPECDDFSRIAPGAPADFYDDRHFALNYTSTQQLITEYIAPGVVDPETGLPTWACNE